MGMVLMSVLVLASVLGCSWCRGWCWCCRAMALVLVVLVLLSDSVGLRFVAVLSAGHTTRASLWFYRLRTAY